MFDRLLIPLDPTAPDPTIYGTGFNLASIFDAAVHVLGVTEGVQTRDQLRTDQEEDARETIQGIVSMATDCDLDATGEVRSGEVHEEILGAVERHDIELIVMGTQARTGVERMVLGNVAEKVLRESPVPVLSITPEASPSADDDELG